jgi:molybdopterin synthase catalytic subunit
MDDWVALLDSPLPLLEVWGSVADPAAGGVVIFAGTTRAEAGPEGRPLEALEYEAYAEMAQRQLQSLAAEARRRWPVTRLVLLHRMGRVPPGEPSVVIAVATPHRAEAFAACRWLIDQLKEEVCIWKREVYRGDQGDEGRWVHPMPPPA